MGAGQLQQLAAALVLCGGCHALTTTLAAATASAPSALSLPSPALGSRSASQAPAQPTPAGYAFVGKGNCLPNLAQWYGINVSEARCAAVCAGQALCVGYDWGGNAAELDCRVRYPYAPKAAPPAGFTADVTGHPCDNITGGSGSTGATCYRRLKQPSYACPPAPAPLAAPPPSPPPPLLPLQYGWDSLAQLTKEPLWHRYLDSVYNASTLNFPFSLLQLQMFYADRLPRNISRSLKFRKQDEASGTVAVIGAPLRFGELYRLWGGNMPTTGWEHMDVWRCIYPVGQCTAPSSTTDYGVCPAGAVGPEDGVLFSGLPSHAKVEVTHRLGDPLGSGMWFYWARGSGIYFDLRRTAVFRDHDQLAALCKIPCSGIQNDEFCIKNENNCIKNDDLI